MPALKEIAFTTDKHGKPIAYRHSLNLMRHFRIGLEEAKLLIATGQAKEIAFRPYSK